MSNTTTTCQPIKITATADGRYRAECDDCVAYGATEIEAVLAVFEAGNQRLFEPATEKGQN